MYTVARTLFFLLATALLLAPPALAGQREGAFSLSPMVGYHVFEGDQRTDDSVSYGLAGGYNLTKNWAIEFDLRYTPTETDFDVPGVRDFDVDVWTGSMNALYHFNPDGPFVPYVVAGFGGMVFDGGSDGVSEDGDGDDDTDFMMNAGAGLKYFFTQDLAFRAEARYVADLHSDRQYDQLPGSDDPDHNMIAMAGLYWQFGGPPPAPAPPADSDMDGVPDVRDKCPGTPLGVAVDAVGCPPAPPKPAPAPVAKPAPVPPPPPAPAPLPVKKEILSFNLLFGLDKYQITDEMVPVLEQAKKILDEDKAASFEVMGHTCALGSDAYNQKLSERRAASVKSWLVSHGIAAERLNAVGYGESKPKYDNKTEESRKLNRRVEITTK